MEWIKEVICWQVAVVFGLFAGRNARSSSTQRARGILWMIFEFESSQFRGKRFYTCWSRCFVVPESSTLSMSLW